MKAVCVVPMGMEEGTEVELPSREFGLVVGEPVEFRFLSSTQRADGSWYVGSRSAKFQPYFESGFPYEHDQWISSMATGWATAALALSTN